MRPYHFAAFTLSTAWTNPTHHLLLPFTGALRNLCLAQLAEEGLIPGLGTIIGLLTLKLRRGRLD